MTRTSTRISRAPGRGLPRIPRAPAASPRRAASRGRDPHRPRRTRWGALANLFVLDDRQYRAHQACPRASRGGSNVVGPWCTDEPRRAGTTPGVDQERWLGEGLGGVAVAVEPDRAADPHGAVRTREQGRMQHWTGTDGTATRGRAAVRRALGKRRGQPRGCWAATCTRTTWRTSTPVPTTRNRPSSRPNSAGLPSPPRDPVREAWPPFATRPAHPLRRRVRRGYTLLDFVMANRAGATGDRRCACPGTVAQPWVP